MYYYYTQNIFVYYLVSLYYVDEDCVALSLTLPHKSLSLRALTAQTTDGDIHSAEPLLFSPNGFTLHRVASAWATLLQLTNISYHIIFRRVHIKLQKAPIRFAMSVNLSACISLATTGQTFLRSGIGDF